LCLCCAWPAAAFRASSEPAERVGASPAIDAAELERGSLAAEALLRDPARLRLAEERLAREFGSGLEVAAPAAPAGAEASSRLSGELQELAAQMRAGLHELLSQPPARVAAVLEVAEELGGRRAPPRAHEGMLEAFSRAQELARKSGGPQDRIFGMLPEAAALLADSSFVEPAAALAERLPRPGNLSAAPGILLQALEETSRTAQRLAPRANRALNETSKPDARFLDGPLAKAIQARADYQLVSETRMARFNPKSKVGFGGRIGFTLIAAHDQEEAVKNKVSVFFRGGFSWHGKHGEVVTVEMATMYSFVKSMEIIGSWTQIACRPVGSELAKIDEKGWDTRFFGRSWMGLGKHEENSSVDFAPLVVEYMAPNETKELRFALLGRRTWKNPASTGKSMSFVKWQYYPDKLIPIFGIRWISPK